MSGPNRLPADVLNFLRRADKMLTDAEAAAAVDDDDDEAASMQQRGMRVEVIDNIVAQLAGAELACAFHVYGTSALQRTLRLGNDPQRAALAAPVLRADPALVLQDKYASHVVEAILSLVYGGLGAGSDGIASDDAGSLGALLVEFCDSLLAGGVGALRGAMQDRHGTHVLRSLLRTLSGHQPESAEVVGGKGTGKGGKGGGGGGGGGKGSGGGGGAGSGGGGGGSEPARPVPAAFTERLVALSSALAAPAKARGGSDGGDGGGAAAHHLAYHPTGSPALQELLAALPSPSAHFDALALAALRWPRSALPPVASEAPPPAEEAIIHVQDMAQDRVASHVLQALLRVGGAAWWHRLHATVRGKLAPMAQHGTANYVLQQLIEASPSSDDLQKISHELLSEDALKALLPGRAGVVWKLAQASARHRSGGQKLVKQLRLALDDAGATAGAADGRASAFARGMLRLGSRSADDDVDDAAAGAAWAAAEGSAKKRQQQQQAAGAVVAVGAMGAQLAQALFELPRAQAEPLLASMAALSADQLGTLSRHPQGSRVVEAACVCAGGFVAAASEGSGATPGKGAGAHKGKGKGGGGAKGGGSGGGGGGGGGGSGAAAAAQLLSRLWQVATKLARDRYGVHVFGAAFSASELERKEAFLTELIPIEAELQASGAGGALLRRLQFTHWRQHRESWARQHQTARNTRRAFAEILQDEPPRPKQQPQPPPPPPPPPQKQQQTAAPTTGAAAAGGDAKKFAAKAAPKRPREAKASELPALPREDEQHLDMLFDGAGGGGGGGGGGGAGGGAAPKKKKQRLDATAFGAAVAGGKRASKPPKADRPTQQGGGAGGAPIKKRRNKGEGGVPTGDRAARLASLFASQGADAKGGKRKYSMS